MAIRWEDYPVQGVHDELIGGPGQPRPGAEALCAYLASLDDAALSERVSAAEQLIRLMGITFRVYGEDGGSIDRHWPYDLIPRILPLPEWRRIEEGLKQRVEALNSSSTMCTMTSAPFGTGSSRRSSSPPRRTSALNAWASRLRTGVWAHICGSDLVRDRDGTVYVSRTTCACPRACPTCWKPAGHQAQLP
jgi:uncharacterized circularly permuted ATP-grasp superfamily protein